MNNIRIGIAGLVIALVAIGIFAYVQTQNLSELQTDSTESVAQLENVGTESAANANSTATQAAQEFDDAAATSTQSSENEVATGTRVALVNNAAQQRLQSTSTQSAENADATATQAAQEFDDAAATSTQSAENADATASQAAQEFEDAAATSTQSAENADATATQFAENADATAMQMSDDAATEAAIGTDTADILVTQYIELTVAAIVYSESESTLQAQSAEVYSTAQAGGTVGEGVLGESAAIPDNFALFQGVGYEIVLPESFEGGDLLSNPRSFFTHLDSLGLSETGDYLREQDEDFLFFGIDTNIVNGVPRATVSIIREEPIIADTNLIDYLGGAYFDLKGDFALISMDILFINGQQTGRVVLDQGFEVGSVRQLQYIFMADGTFYIVTFSAPANEFAAQRLTFETSAASFRVR